jgi:ADP-heptose:LPS heptosyltransferase
MSLPHLLELNEIPAKTPYLAAEPDLVEAWAQKLGAKEKPRIGITWQGNPNYEADHQRSLAFKLLEPMLTLPEFQFISLQKGFGQDQIKGQNAKIVDLGDELDNAAGFVDSAAVIANLDLLITSDTAIPHLAGALGKPVWLMLPETPDWRWLKNRSDSPWYPTMRVFRQTTANDWASVVDQVIEALGKKDYL